MSSGVVRGLPCREARPATHDRDTSGDTSGGHPMTGSNQPQTRLDTRYSDETATAVPWAEA
ncbi:hypothetical protein ABZZ80_44670, partial [Streptomyces sp. NPDC006356]